MLLIFLVHWFKVPRVYKHVNVVNESQCTFCSCWHQCVCQVNGELVNTAHSDAGKTRHGAGYFYPTFIEHISLALAVSSRYTHHNKNKNATSALLHTVKFVWLTKLFTRIISTTQSLMSWKVWMNLWEPCMVPEGRMHIAQLTESKIVRSIGKSDLKKIPNARQEGISAFKCIALAPKEAQGTTIVHYHYREL